MEIHGQQNISPSKFNSSKSLSSILYNYKIKDQFADQFTIDYQNKVLWRYVKSYTGFPKNLLNFSVQQKTLYRKGEKHHPTQKPIQLLKYLIGIYTNEGATVLDFTMGSGSTGVACKKTNRQFIGIQLLKCWYYVAKQRIQKE